jgi:hypothetical protein
MPRDSCVDKFCQKDSRVDKTEKRGSGVDKTTFWVVELIKLFFDVKRRAESEF